MSADAAFRASVRADALKQGMTPAMADAIAANVGKAPSAAPRRQPAGGTRARAVVTAGPVPEPRHVRLEKLLALYRAEAAAPALRTCGAPLRVVAVWLAEAVGPAAKATPGAIEALRMRALAWSLKK